ncbi:MoxR family ATPase [Candidatus Pacearchaeota archaeon]|nr:MoxR family ATPase [Candidatus Pacearchaeota archaeon]
MKKRKNKGSHINEKSVDSKSKYIKDIEDVKNEISKLIVGQDMIIEAIIRAILAKGHVLIEGVPGIAKTVLIRTISQTTGCKFSRIQFTVDLLPADITGITTYTPGKGFETIKGPIFSNFIIADEINRAPPKTQSALLEAMQERQVTIGKNTYKLEPPFFVMANNNPLESSGTYKLPEAQIDRFLFKLKMGYPEIEHEEMIIDKNITTRDFEDFNISKILSPSKILRLQELTRDFRSSPQISKYIVRIVDATRNPKKYNLKLGKYIDYGASPRASIALDIAAKADAVMKGQKIVLPQNIKNISHDVLRHRILLNYEGQVENIDNDKIVDEILSKIKVP